MLHGDPQQCITPLEADGDDDQGMRESAGELERGARGPAVEIQVRRPGGEPNLDIPADLTEDGTKIHLAHVDTDFGSGIRSGTRSGQPFESKVLNVSNMP